MNNPVIYQVRQLLSRNKISFDKEELTIQIQSHPSYPSIHSITGVLDHFNISNLALDVPSSESVLKQLPKTFLAQLKTDEGQDFAVITKKKDAITAHFTVEEKVTYSQEKFLNQFTGILIAVEKDETAPLNSKTGLLLWRKGLLGLLGVTFLGLLSLIKPPLEIVAYTILSVVGIITSIAITKQQLGMQTNLGNAFCSGESNVKDCNAVLTSDGAHILGLKLSDLSIVYFGSLLISSIISILFVIDSTPLLFISLAASPVVIYSVYYQYAFAKAWCPLCLIVAAVLVIQAIIGATNLLSLQEIPLTTTGILLVVVIFLIVLTTWLFLEPNIKSLKELKQQKLDFFKFKKNYALFSTLLEKSPIKDTTITNTSEITFGNPNSDLSIVIVTSPICGHCKPVHEHIEKILNTYENLVHITIRFSVNTEDATSSLLKITSRLTEIYHNDGKENCLKAMHDIYGGMSPEKWLNEWGSCKNTMVYNQILNSQFTWCRDKSINFTPAILINGRSYPSEYVRTDLIYFIEELHDSYTTLYTVEAATNTL